jgi:YesN/AraC family two-component response regulator
LLFFQEKKKRHFNEYRNTWRINHSKKHILERKAAGMTMEATG